MHTDKISFNNPQKKSTGKPIDTADIDKELESPVETSSGKGLNETRPGPGNEVDGQVAKM
jgi:hypothetical protein